MAGKDRKKELARQRYERQQARRVAEEAAAKRRRAIGWGAVAAVVVLGVAGGTAYALTRGGDEKPAEPVAEAGTCVYQDAPSEGEGAKNVGKPPTEPAYKGTVKATVKTGLGEIKMDLDADKAPCTVNAIAYLAEKGYFDKTECHRVAENPPMLQCGDPTATGAGGPGFQYTTENTDGAKYTEGVVAMANSGSPDSNGSQFFIMYDDSGLSPDYTVFGKVTSGIGIVKDVAKAGDDGSNSAGGGKPKKKVEINSISIAKNE